MLLTNKPLYTPSNYENIEDAVKPEAITESFSTVYGNYTSELIEQDAKKMVERAALAYTRDGFVKRSVDSYEETYLDIKIKCKDTKALDYLFRRLNMIGLKSGEPWKVSVSKIVHEVWKTGNACMIKIRGESEGVRGFYEDKPNPIAAIAVYSINLFKPNRNSLFNTWMADTSIKKEFKSKTTLPGPYMISKYNISLNDREFLQGRDIIHFAYKQNADTRYGWGHTMSAIDDALALKHLERSTLAMINKYKSPMLHHKVIKGNSIHTNVDASIQEAKHIHRTAGPNSVIITGPNHEIKAIGAENSAMRLEQYLEYYKKRLGASLHMTPFIMGLEGGTLGSAKAASEIILRKARFVLKQIEYLLIDQLFNEILYEGGFDPYGKAKLEIQWVLLEDDLEIKLRNHWADLFNKGVISFETAAAHLGLEDNPDLKKTKPFTVDLKVKPEQKQDIPASNNEKGVATKKPATDEEIFQIVIDKIKSNPDLLDLILQEKE